jgi:hypothetical protein
MPQGYKTCGNEECRKLVRGPAVRRCNHCGFQFYGRGYQEQQKAAQAIVETETFDNECTVADLYPLKAHSQEQLSLLANTELKPFFDSYLAFTKQWGMDDHQLDQLTHTLKLFNYNYARVSQAARSMLNLQVA